MQTAEVEDWDYLRGIDSFSFTGETPAGRVISVEVPWSLIKKLAEWGNKAPPKDRDRGHMMWHLRNPHTIYPCEICEKEV